VRRGWAELVEPDEVMVLVYGPYVALPPGSYEIRYRLASDAGPGAVRADVCTDFGSRVIAVADVSADTSRVETGGYRTIRLEFDSEETLENVEFRVFYSGGGELRVDYVESVRRADGPPPPAASVVQPGAARQ
jgi:hypothetical protein